MHSFILTRTTFFIVTISLALISSLNLQADEKQKPDDFQPNAPKKVPAQPALNQLKQVIQGLFGKPNAIPEKNTNLQTKSKDPDYYRFPQDLEQERRFKSAQKLIKDQQWEAAREKLQLMLENSINLPVHMPGERSLITDRELIYQLLKLLPQEQRIKFNRQYEALAEKQFNDAQLDESPPEIYAEIATRFAGTTFGLKAMNYLTSYHMERGEFGLAEHYLQRLLIHEAPVTKTTEWKTKAAFVFKQTGKQSLIPDLFQSDNEVSNSDQQIKIGGTTETPQNWLNQQILLNTSSNPLLDEWPMLFGSPSRSARAKNADPLLIPRWSHPLTSNHTIQAQLNLIQEDLISAQRATVPTLPPIAINGKIVFRTLRGIQVIDAQSGTPLWESTLKNSPEASYISAQLKGLKTPQARGLFDPEPKTQSFTPYNGTNPDAHPLTSLIYRNANWGSNSSDGQRLFILENMHLNFGSSGYSRNINRFGRRANAFAVNNLSSNQLVAYDLESGQPLWKIGGTKFDEPFDLPLAGTFFFGAPTPAGDELYIVGERDREIRVYALNPKTGEERWSQQIGNPDQDIALDMVRRWWIAPIAVDQGVLVCPTTIGLLTAIDRLNHSILWSTKYTISASSSRNQRFNRARQTPFKPLNQRWCPSAPVITGNKVIYTPPDEDTLICLDLITGSPCWAKRAKETFLYLAGIVDNHILLVSMNGVTAISAATGKTVWKTPFKASAGHPSGQAVIADQRLHIPLQDGQIWTLDVKSGMILNKLFSTSDNQSLGNLMVHNGQFLSLSPAGLVSYEQKQTYEAEIKLLKQQDSQNPLALFKESKLLMMSHRFQDALTKLQQIDSNQLPAKDQEHFHQALVNCLTSLIRSDFQKHDQLVIQLKQRVRSDKERIELQRLMLERFMAKKQFSDALDRLLQLADAPVDTFFQTAATETQIDCWIAGKASDIWSQSDPAFRDSFSQKLIQKSQQAMSSSQTQQERFQCQFGFHDSVIPVLESLIKTSMNSKHFHESELWINRLMKHRTPQVEARAMAYMIELCLQHKLPQDAAYYLKQLSAYESNFIVLGNIPLAQFLEQKQQAILTDVEKNRRSHWRPKNLKLIVGSSSRYYYPRDNKLNTSVSHLPFYRDRKLAVNPKENRLMITTATNKRMLWSTPLRSSDQSRSTGFNESEIVGHNLILQHRDMLHFFDLVDQKLIWSQKLEKERTNGFYSNSFQISPAPMSNEMTLVARRHPSIATRHIGTIAAANSDYTCYYSRRKIVLIDTRTGKTRWTHDNVDKETRVLGDDHSIYLVTRDRVTKKILRASDGKQLETGNIDDDLKHAIYQSESNFVSLKRLSSRTDSKTGKKLPVEILLYCMTPQSNEIHWKHSFSEQSQFGMFNSHYLSVLSPQGEVYTVDLQTGKKTALESLPQTELKPDATSKKRKYFYLVADNEYIYFVSHTPVSNVISVSVPSIPINGMLYVFDRQTGKRIWNQPFKEKYLILNSQNRLPVNLLVSRKHKRIDNRTTNIIHLKAVDKQTGKNLLTWEAPIDSNIRSLEVDYRQKMVEILTNGARIRLYDADELAIKTLKQPNSSSKTLPFKPREKK